MRITDWFTALTIHVIASGTETRSHGTYWLGAIGKRVQQNVSRPAVAQMYAESIELVDMHFRVVSRYYDETRYRNTSRVIVHMGRATVP